MIEPFRASPALRSRSRGPWIAPSLCADALLVAVSHAEPDPLDPRYLDVAHN